MDWARIKKKRGGWLDWAIDKKDKGREGWIGLDEEKEEQGEVWMREGGEGRRKNDQGGKKGGRESHQEDFPGNITLEITNTHKSYPGTMSPFTPPP